MDYLAIGTYPNGDPWAIHVTDTGIVGHPGILLSLATLDGEPLPVTPTGPFLTFDRHNPSHIRHFLVTTFDTVEEFGDIPDLPPIPTLPRGAVG